MRGIMATARRFFKRHRVSGHFRDGRQCFQHQVDALKAVVEDLFQQRAEEGQAVAEYDVADTDCHHLKIEKVQENWSPQD